MGATRKTVGQGARLAAMLVVGASLTACASRPTPPATYKVGQPYVVGGVRYVPREQPDYDETGIASWYGDAYHMKATANGERFDMNGMSAAHTTLPMPSLVDVTNLDNGRRVRLRVNDRGPFVAGRIIDVSREAARVLQFQDKGVARVRVRYVGPAPLTPEGKVRYAARRPFQRNLLMKAQYDGPISTAPRAPRPLQEPPPPPMTVLRPSTLTDNPAALVPATPPRAPRTAFLPPTRSDRPEPRGLPPISLPSVPTPPLPPVAVAPPPVPMPTMPAPSLSSMRPEPEIKVTRAEPPSIDAPAPASVDFLIQAGAFADFANAERAVSRLSGLGEAEIIPIPRDGTLLYRVVVRGAGDQANAFNLRERVMGIGFPDARILSGF